MRRALAAMAALAAVLLSVSPVLAADDFSRWAAVVISGDNRAAHIDAPTQTFDNARRDIVKALETRGFAAANIAAFSVEPDRHPDTHPGPAKFATIGAALRRLAAQAPDGCLFYLTSHGSPEGVVVGQQFVTPGAFARLIGSACGARPTVVVISACYSGVFVPALKGEDRLVLTAARRDRSSFGCGESDKYPYFDGCVLEALPTSTDFVALAAKARACVVRRERMTGMRPPSEPQTSLGARFRDPRFAPAG